MLKITDEVTVSQQVYPTASSAVSGSTALDMSQYNKALVSVLAHRLPDQKGEGVITVSLYETTNTTLNGQEVASSVVTGSITSASDVYLEAEIKGKDMTVDSNYRYLYPYVVSSTGTVLSASVIRGDKRYEV